jgi:hypothetical protein
MNESNGFIDPFVLDVIDELSADVVGDDPHVQLNTRVLLSEKRALMDLAKSKGAKDFKSFIRMLIAAKEVRIML